VNEEAGVNSRLDPIQAVVLRVKLAVLDAWTERRRAVATAYTTGLAESGLRLPHVPEWANPAWHLYVVRTSDRDRLQGRITQAGIGTLIHYPIPPHMQKAYINMEILPEALPLARDLAREVLSLPMGPQLSLDQVQDIVNALKNT
jgi:dTDP-4-amino-4,6-dideoxygalactose transaminase